MNVFILAASDQPGSCRHRFYSDNRCVLAHTEPCSVCKKGVKNPDALAGYACLDDRGNHIGDSNRGDTAASCSGKGGVWTSYTCQTMQDYHSATYFNGE